MQEPRRLGYDELAPTTPLYIETYIALELLHCSYGEYVQRVPRDERLLHQLYLMLKATKEQHAEEWAEQQRQAEQEGPDAPQGRW